MKRPGVVLIQCLAELQSAMIGHGLTLSLDPALAADSMISLNAHAFRPERTIQGYVAMNAIRKGQVRWVGKGNPMSQRQFIHSIFGVGA